MPDAFWLMIVDQIFVDIWCLVILLLVWIGASLLWITLGQTGWDGRARLNRAKKKDWKGACLLEGGGPIEVSKWLGGSSWSQGPVWGQTSCGRQQFSSFLDELPDAFSDILLAVSAADAFADISSNLFNSIENLRCIIDFIPDSGDWVDITLIPDGWGYEAKIILWAWVLLAHLVKITLWVWLFLGRLVEGRGWEEE